MGYRTGVPRNREGNGRQRPDDPLRATPQLEPGSATWQTLSPPADSPRPCDPLPSHEPGLGSEFMWSFSGGPHRTRAALPMSNLASLGRGTKVAVRGIDTVAGIG